MGFLAPALPWIAKGGAALGGALLGRKAQSSAMKRSPEEMVGLTGAQQGAAGLGKTGGTLLKTGQSTVQSGLNTLQQPANYWSRLLGGNRASMAQATAGARGSITDIYRGAERGLERSNVRGAQRDVASGELNRQRAGQIAGLTTGVQPAAAQSLADIGGQISGIGLSTTATGGELAGKSADIFQNLLGQGYQNRRYGREEGEKASKSIGSFIFDMLSGIGGKKGGGGIPTISGRRIGTGMGYDPTSVRPF